MVGVGCMIDSCRHCEPCEAGEQNYCEGPNSWLATYNGPMVPAAMAPTGENSYGRDNTFGGYSDVIVAPEDFVLSVPSGLRPEVAAPILCAGVTTYSPLRHWGVKAGDKVGIIGFGGLGDMAAKLAKAMGAEVTVFTRTEAKLAEASRLGVNGVLESDKDALKVAEGQLRLHPEHGAGKARPQPVRDAAQARQHDRGGRRPRAIGPGEQPATRNAPHQHRRLDHRQHRRDTGGPGFLCRARHRSGQSRS